MQNWYHDCYPKPAIITVLGDWSQLIYNVLQWLSALNHMNLFWKRIFTNFHWRLKLFHAYVTCMVVTIAPSQINAIVYHDSMYTVSNRIFTLFDICYSCFQISTYTGISTFISYKIMMQAIKYSCKPWQSQSQ